MSKTDWNQFEKTGNIKHYLRFRGVDGYVPAGRDASRHPNRDG